MNRIFKFSALVIGSLALITGSVQAGAPESKDPIKLAINEWTGQYVTTHIPE
jgi:glycine betaine/proline transport system substrate-binding protein